MHNLPGQDLLSVVDTGLRARLDLQQRLAADPDFGVRAPHRIDSETSGVVLLALRASALTHLAVQFSTRGVVKHYLALVHGRLAAGAGCAEAVLWRWGLARSAGGYRSPAGRGPRQACRTHVHSLAFSRHYTLVRCRPVTGRKHQIRRHARLAGHPVVGDRRYGSRRAIRHLENQCGFSRLALHADSIEFVPPGQTAAVTVRSAGLPTELAELFEADR
jgi:23S rRNA-/tRNA-specific pseudouridylate synthase